jgi:hypothetical protein
MQDSTERSASMNDGMVVPSHGHGRLKPFPKGVSPNPGGRGGLWYETQQMCRARSPDAVNKLIQLLECGDERVEMLAATKLLEWAWGAPQTYKPGADDGRMVIDLKNLSRPELAALGSLLTRGAVRPATDDVGVTICAAEEAGPE